MKNVVWGSIVIALGVLLLMSRLDLLHVTFANLWPLILLAIGIAHLGERRIGSGVMLILLSAAFLGCTFHWLGMTYERSWPLFMIAAGTGMVIRALTGGERLRRRGEVNHE